MRLVCSLSRLLFLLVVAVSAVTGCATMENSYQQDADVVRMGHLYIMGNQIEEFHKKTGRYPLQGKFDLPAFVFFGTKKQIDSTTFGPKYKYIVVSMSTLRDELEEVLDDVRIPIDPQSVPVGYRAPIYLYFIVGDEFYFAVHLYHEYPFANKIGKENNKLEIGSQEVPGRVWKYEELIANEEYLKAFREHKFSASIDISPIVVEIIIRAIMESL